MSASEFARDKTEAARLAAANALDSAREGASAATQKISDGIAQAPLVALAGGLAVGVVAAALLPRSNAEKALLGSVGGRLANTARTAVDAAREAGIAKLDEAGLSRDRAGDTIRSLLDGARDAARSSAEAAIGAVREKR